MLTAIPLLLIPVVLYNIVVLFGASGNAGMTQADAVLRDPLFSLPMASGAQWSIGWGDLILFLGLILLFFELIKSTSSQKVAIVNHALSMILFIVVLVEFLLVPRLRDLDLLPDRGHDPAGRAGRLHRHHHRRPARIRPRRRRLGADKGSAPMQAGGQRSRPKGDRP
jgi:hypothetical protein